jgi:hypothetical protein
MSNSTPTDDALSIRVIGSGGSADFTGLPALQPAVVCILNSGSADAAKWSATLQSELRNALLRVNSGVTGMPNGCVHHATEIATCRSCSDPGRRQAIVLIGDGSTNDTTAFAGVAAGPKTRVLPVYKAGTSMSALPNHIQPFNAFFWSGSITEAIPSVLQAAGLLPESRRIFVSYRRLETEPLADQLFDALNRKRFQVFVDRFVIPPAVDFQRRLDQELADKSMVLLLESEQFNDSEWSRHEATYAVQYRLGLMVLRMPYGRTGPKFPQVPSVTDDVRSTLERPAFQADPEIVKDRQGREFLQWGRLEKDALDQVVAEVEQRHDTAMLNRRQYIRDTVRQALKNAGAEDYGLRADGLLVAGPNPKNSSATRRYMLWLTTRPPDLPDFHLTSTGCSVAAEKGVIVGPLALIEREPGERLQWLTGLCKFACEDEGQITTMAELIAEGKL